VYVGKLKQHSVHVTVFTRDSRNCYSAS